MVWTAPRTWTTGELVTGAIMNTHVRDNLTFLRAHHGCYLYKSGNQTVANGNNDVVTWNSEVYDTDALHDTVTNNSRITVPSGFDGYWGFYASVDSDADASNHTQFNVRFRKNAAGNNAGGTLLDVSWGVGHTIRYSVPIIWFGNLAAGDYVEVFAAAVSEAHDVQGGASTDSSFQAWYLGN